MAIPPPPPGFQIVTQPMGGARPAIPGPPRMPAPQTAAQAAYDSQQARNAGLEGQLKQLQIAEEQRKAAEDRDKQKKSGEQTTTATENLLRVIQRMDRVAKDANDNGGWGETGRSGAFLRSLPKFIGTGTGAYDIQRDLDLVGSNAAIESLMTMRRESPTGAGVGNVALGEMQLMKDKYGIFDPDQSHDSFMRNLGEGKREFLRMLSRINPQAARQYIESNPDGIWVSKEGKWMLGRYRRGAKPQAAPKVPIGNLRQGADGVLEWHP